MTGPRPARQCIADRRDGRRCTAYAALDTDHCIVHLSPEAKLAALRQRGDALHDDVMRRTEAAEDGWWREVVEHFQPTEHT